VRSSCVTHSPESQPCEPRAGFGGPTPPERIPALAAIRPVSTPLNDLRHNAPGRGQAQGETS